MEEKKQFLDGLIDMHVHHGPDPERPRVVDALEAARQAAAAGMKAIVLKNHEYSTVPLACQVQKLVPEVRVFGSLCLDDAVGGLNSVAVAGAAKLGAGVIWMPTFSSRQDHKRRGEEGGIKIIDGRGRLVNEVGEVLQLVLRYDMVLATGHISREETFVLAESARSLGIERIVATHVSTKKFGAGLTLEDQKVLAKMGVFIEHCFVCTMPAHDQVSPVEIVEQISGVGPEHCIIASDFGQLHNPPPVEGMRMFVETLKKFGLSEADIETMAKKNPAWLLKVT